MVWRVTVVLVSVDRRQGKTYDLHCGFTKHGGTRCPGGWWLILIRHVEMPDDDIYPNFEKPYFSIIFRTPMNQVYVWIALRGATGGVNVQTPETGADIYFSPS